MLRIQDETKQQALMMNNEVLTSLKKSALKGILREQESMSRHTSWKTGGVADYYFSPVDLEDLSAFLKMLPECVAVMWVGKGSNLLVRDGGIDGAVISVDGVLDKFELISDTEIELGAGLACVKAARRSAKAGLSGIEFLAGIPGSVGGALAMNAGAWGGELWEFVTSVETINRQGEVNRYERSHFDIAYRSVSIPDNEWFISARIKLTKDEKEQVKERIRDMLSERAETQPLGQLSCGSVFRNPENDHAARLIEACGLKGYCIGGACVSEKHANFIINTGHASSADIESLIEHVRSVVNEKHQVSLIPEVRIVGKHFDKEAC